MLLSPIWPLSPKGWIKVAILPTCAGKGVPGNFDSNTQEIVSNGVLTVASYGVHKPLSENLLLRSLLLTTASKECVLTLGILLLVDLSLPSSLFASPLPLSPPYR